MHSASSDSRCSRTTRCNTVWSGRRRVYGVSCRAPSRHDRAAAWATTRQGGAHHAPVSTARNLVSPVPNPADRPALGRCPAGPCAQCDLFESRLADPVFVAAVGGCLGGSGAFPAFGQGAPDGVVEPVKDTAGMVDATSIVPDADRAVADKVTVKDGESGKDQTYIEGKAENIVDPMHTWIAQARAAHAPLKAGISGTTARFAGATVRRAHPRHPGRRSRPPPSAQCSASRAVADAAPPDMCHSRLRWRH